MQRLLSFVLAPAARLAGYRNYYPAWAFHAPAPRALDALRTPNGGAPEWNGA
jgi:hypothetical protein